MRSFAQQRQRAGQVQSAIEAYGLSHMRATKLSSALLPNQALQPTSPKMRCIFGAAAELGR